MAVRVRFCPSPTGIPHVGLVRTALFNWASTPGTHRRHLSCSASTPTPPATARRATTRSRTLRWLGLNWDEGVEVGGPHGPYRQSQRADIYRDVIAQPLAAGECTRRTPPREEVGGPAHRGGPQPETGL